jgi:hypothetical protein
MPEGLRDNVDVYPVAGAVRLIRRTVRFGPYATRAARVGFTVGSGPTPLAANTSLMEQRNTGSFELWRAERRVVHAKCESLSKKFVRGDETTEDYGFRCNLRWPGGVETVLTADREPAASAATIHSSPSFRSPNRWTNLFLPSGRRLGTSSRTRTGSLVRST